MSPRTFSTFSGSTADSAWNEAVDAFRQGKSTVQGGRGGDVHEIMRAAFSIDDPLQRWIVSRYPPMNPAFALAEVVWIMSGRKDSSFLNFFNSQFSLYAGSGSEFHGAYGYRLRNHFGIDQLDRAFHVLGNDSRTRQTVLQIWDGRQDLPLESGVPADDDIPCSLVSMLSIRESRLEWTQIMRSNDMLLGFPHNVVQFTSLQEIIAGWLNVDVGSYHHLSNSLHVYDRDLEAVLNSKTYRVEPNTDSLCLPKSQSEREFSKLADIGDLLRHSRLDTKTLFRVIEERELPKSYSNIAYVLCAEGARRHKDLYTMSALMDRCSNPTFCLLFDNWLSRLGIS